MTAKVCLFTSLGVVVVLMGVVALVTASPGDRSYTTRYDNIDLDEILHSDRLLNGYIKCLMERGPCTADGKELKVNLADALQTDCMKCSEKQKTGSKKVIQHLIDHKHAQWKELEAKYDPQGIYRTKYNVN